MGQSRRDRHEEEEDWDEDRPLRRPRKKGRSLGVPPFLIVIALLLPVLAGAGFLLWWLVLEPMEETQKVRSRLLGEWEATAPEATWLQLHLRITEGELVMTGKDTRSGKSGAEKMNWQVTRVKKGVVSIHLRRSTAEKDNDWSVEFDSDDQMRVTTVGSTIPTRVFKRLGKTVSGSSAPG
jgi:hypothetical protein